MRHPRRYDRESGSLRGVPSSGSGARTAPSPWSAAVLQLPASCSLPHALLISSSHCAQPLRARRSSLMWPLKVRVGANSPSLCPTIDSVTNTGTCLRPSCTAIVCPSMSGMIVERRDQVLMTDLEPLSFAASTFLSRWSSMNGPFLRLRGISCLPSCSDGDGCQIGLAEIQLSTHQRFLPPLRRRRTIRSSLALFGRRVRPSGLPPGLTG